MTIRELRVKFSQFREFETEDANKLLDFAKRAYIFEMISAGQYKNLIRELENLGAVIPEIHLNQSFTQLN